MVVLVGEATEGTLNCRLGQNCDDFADVLFEKFSVGKNGCGAGSSELVVVSAANSFSRSDCP